MPVKNFTVYKSSAGSGKTFTLVKEYLVLALSDEYPQPQAYRHILAITFTNKAASEMKERIVSALQGLAQPDYSNLPNGIKSLLEQLKQHPKLNSPRPIDDTVIRKRAQNVLSAVLHNYSDFAIGTIDSFVHKVVRTFAFDLKIPMNFDLEMDEDKLLTQAIDLLIAQIGTDENITKALVDFAESKTDDEKSWHIENDLKYFAKNLLNDEGVVHVEKLRELKVEDFFKIKNTLQSEIKVFEAFVKKCGEEGLQIIEKSGVSHDLFAGGAKSGIAKYFSYLQKVDWDKLTPSDTVQKNINADNWYATKTSAADKNAIEGIKQQLLVTYDKAWDYIQEHLQEVLLFKLIHTNMYSLAVLNEIEKLLNEYKSQNNVVHISEFNKMIAKIVLNEDVPFIYERLGEKYKNYLIDEFQDTSVLQFQNLLPLINNSLSENHFTMLVGDGKQAIYRWRGGEVEQFAMLPEIYAHNDNPAVKQREQALIRNYSPQLLQTNQRSKSNVVEFNNSFFKTLSGKLNPKYQVIYEGVEQLSKLGNDGGYVQVEFISAENKDEVFEQNLKRVFEIVVDLKQQNYNYKDIAVLVRKNTDGSEVANYLSQQGIPVLSSDSLLLSNSAEVNFISSLLNYLNNTDNQIIQAQLLEYFVVSKRIEVSSIHYLLAECKEHGFAHILKKVCPDFNIYKLNKMALYELCEELVLLFKLNDPANAYIQFYLDEVLNYSNKQNNNLSDFVNYWEDKKDALSLIVPEGMDAVTIMTIHKSKGLEFPAVILPFASASNQKGKKELWIHLDNDKIPELTSALVSNNVSLQNTAYAPLYEEEKNKSLLDTLNVLYVALTRPEERLYVLTGKPSKSVRNLNSLSDIFAYYFQTAGNWKEGENIYSFGFTENRKQKDKEQIISNIQLETFNSNRWREHIKMRAAAPSIWNLEQVSSKKDYGILVHTALAKVKYQNDVEPALSNMFLQGLINAEEKLQLRTTLNKIVNHPQLEKYFSSHFKIKNEAEIISLTGETFRPDRVVMDKNTAVIIDYKTGEEKSIYKKQLQEYSDLLTQMGFMVAKKLLVYIGEDIIISE